MFDLLALSVLFVGQQKFDVLKSNMIANADYKESLKLMKFVTKKMRQDK